MTSGATRGTLAALLLMPLICGAAPEVDELLRQLAKPPPSTTEFREARYSKLLDRPVLSRGVLEYRGPGQLARIVTEPFDERTEINGDAVSVEREGQKPRRFSLRRAPELRNMFAGFSAVLAGDREALERDFEIRLQGESAIWKMTLTPKSSRVARFVRSIVIDGTGGEARCIRMIEPDDDASIMMVGRTAREPLPEMPERIWLEHHCEATAS